MGALREFHGSFEDFRLQRLIRFTAKSRFWRSIFLGTPLNVNVLFLKLCMSIIGNFMGVLNDWEFYWELSVSFPEAFWELSGRILGALWELYVSFMEALWERYGSLIGGLLKLYGSFMVYGSFMGVLWEFSGAFLDWELSGSFLGAF